MYGRLKLVARSALPVLATAATFHTVSTAAEPSDVPPVASVVEAPVSLVDVAETKVEEPEKNVEEAPAKADVDSFITVLVDKPVKAKSDLVSQGSAPVGAVAAVDATVTAELERLLADYASLSAKSERELSDHQTANADRAADYAKQKNAISTRIAELLQPTCESDELAARQAAALAAVVATASENKEEEDSRIISGVVSKGKKALKAAKMSRRNEKSSAESVSDEKRLLTLARHAAEVYLINETYGKELKNLREQHSTLKSILDTISSKAEVMANTTTELSERLSNEPALSFETFTEVYNLRKGLGVLLPMVEETIKSIEGNISGTLAEMEKNVDSRFTLVSEKLNALRDGQEGIKSLQLSAAAAAAAGYELLKQIQAAAQSAAISNQIATSQINDAVQTSERSIAAATESAVMAQRAASLASSEIINTSNELRSLGDRINQATKALTSGVNATIASTEDAVSNALEVVSLLDESKKSLKTQNQLSSSTLENLGALNDMSDRIRSERDYADAIVSSIRASVLSTIERAGASAAAEIEKIQEAERSARATAAENTAQVEQLLLAYASEAQARQDAVYRALEESVEAAEVLKERAYMEALAAQEASSQATAEAVASAAAAIEAARVTRERAESQEQLSRARQAAQRQLAELELSNLVAELAERSAAEWLRCDQQSEQARAKLRQLREELDNAQKELREQHSKVEARLSKRMAVLQERAELTERAAKQQVQKAHQRVAQAQKEAALAEQARDQAVKSVSAAQEDVASLLAAAATAKDKLLKDAQVIQRIRNTVKTYAGASPYGASAAAVNISASSSNSDDKLKDAIEAAKRLLEAEKEKSKKKNDSAVTEDKQPALSSQQDDVKDAYVRGLNMIAAKTNAARIATSQRLSKEALNAVRNDALLVMGIDLNSLASRSPADLQRLYARADRFSLTKGINEIVSEAEKIRASPQYSVKRSPPPETPEMSYQRLVAAAAARAPRQPKVISLENLQNSENVLSKTEEHEETQEIDAPAYLKALLGKFGVSLPKKAKEVVVVAPVEKVKQLSVDPVASAYINYLSNGVPRTPDVAPEVLTLPADAPAPATHDDVEKNESYLNKLNNIAASIVRIARPISSDESHVEIVAVPEPVTPEVDLYSLALVKGVDAIKSKNDIVLPISKIAGDVRYAEALKKVSSKQISEENLI